MAIIRYCHFQFCIKEEGVRWEGGSSGSDFFLVKWEKEKKKYKKVK